jgi:hypothetical protein
MTSPRFLYAPHDAEPARTLYVDGTVAGFRSLSHWPGNSTPDLLKRDLSTGIALAWAALPEAERVRQTGCFDQLANNHYDTDGVLSAWAVLQPDKALAAKDLLLRAAATGDFGTWHGADALALELIIMGLPDHPASPLAPTPDLPPEVRKANCYAWCFEHLPSLIAEPFAHVEPWEERMKAILRDIERVDQQDGVTINQEPALDFAVVLSNHPHTRLGLNHAAGSCHRVLLAQQDGSGTRCRFLYRVESWFDLGTRAVSPRISLDRLVCTLNERETNKHDKACWWVNSLDQPVAQMGFSNPDLAGDGFSQDMSPGDFPASAIPLEEIVALLRQALANG